MMEDFIGTYGNRLIVAVVGVGVALLLLAIVLWFIRRRSGSAPFIRGGKNRQPRLQVLDATAVDARRRLVLVRRDNVEHLVMIGGPTDIVIESGIGAIPIIRDIRDPQQDALQSLSAERAITSERAKPVSPPREEDIRPALVPAGAVITPKPATMPEQKQGVALTQPLPAAKLSPESTAKAAPQHIVPPPSQQAIKPVGQPRPPATFKPAQAVPTPRESENPPAIPRAIAQEPVASSASPPPIPVPAPANSLLPGVEMPPVKVTGPRAPEPAVNIPAAAPVQESPLRNQVINQQNAADFLDAARERVLPASQPTAIVTATTANPPRKEPLAPEDGGHVFGDQLTSDFESFLEAEIAKNNASGAPSISLDPDGDDRQNSPVPVLSQDGNNQEDRNVQKEMARIFGEMSVTRDR